MSQKIKKQPVQAKETPNSKGNKIWTFSNCFKYT
jgi:hypothetical protein